MADDYAFWSLIETEENKWAYNDLHMLCASRLVIFLIGGKLLINPVDEYNWCVPLLLHSRCRTLRDIGLMWMFFSRNTVLQTSIFGFNSFEYAYIVGQGILLNAFGIYISTWRLHTMMGKRPFWSLRYFIGIILVIKLSVCKAHMYTVHSHGMDHWTHMDHCGALHKVHTKQVHHWSDRTDSI